MSSAETETVPQEGGSVSAPNAPESETKKEQPEPPGAVGKSADAAQRVLDEIQKLNSGGSGIQTHHGDD